MKNSTSNYKSVTNFCNEKNGQAEMHLLLKEEKWKRKRKKVQYWKSCVSTSSLFSKSLERRLNTKGNGPHAFWPFIFAFFFFCQKKRRKVFFFPFSLRVRHSSFSGKYRRKTFPVIIFFTAYTFRYIFCQRDKANICPFSFFSRGSLKTIFGKLCSSCYFD